MTIQFNLASGAQYHISSFLNLVSEPPIDTLTMSSSTSTNSSNNTQNQATESVSVFQNKSLTSSLSQLCSVKLDRNNFLLWESSILPIIRGHKLERFILGSKPYPQQFLSENAEIKLNLALEEWISKDQLLLGWIYNTLTPEIGL